jgi:hypothetical protein
MRKSTGGRKELVVTATLVAIVAYCAVQAGGRA